jgi:hypothetical protein
MSQACSKCALSGNGHLCTPTSNHSVTGTYLLLPFGAVHPKITRPETEENVLDSRTESAFLQWCTQFNISVGNVRLIFEVAFLQDRFGECHNAFPHSSQRIIDGKGNKMFALGMREVKVIQGHCILEQIDKM